MSERWWWLALLLPGLASAQPDSIAHPPTAGHRLTFSGLGAFDSNVIYNDLVMGIHRGGFLDAEVRERTREAFGRNNRAGYELGATATYAWGQGFAGRPELRPRFSVGYRQFLGMRFTEDSYALAFFGNAHLEGQSAHLGPSAFEQTEFQSVSFGVENPRTGSFLELGVVNGTALNAGDVRTAELFTAVDGRYLELALDGNYQRSDTGSTGFSRGLGAAVNAQWRTPMDVFGMPGHLALSVSDLGFIAWNANSLAVDKDTLLRYEGITVSGIMDLDALILNESTLQDSLGLGYQRGGHVRLLPARVEATLQFGELRHAHPAFQRSAWTIAVAHRLLPGYIPHASATWNLVLAKDLTLQLGGAYGGFGTLRARAGIECFLGEHFAVRIESANALGLASDRTRGKAVAARLEVAW